MRKTSRAKGLARSVLRAKAHAHKLLKHPVYVRTASLVRIATIATTAAEEHGVTFALLATVLVFAVFEFILGHVVEEV